MIDKPVNELAVPDPRRRGAIFLLLAGGTLAGVLMAALTIGNFKPAPQSVNLPTPIPDRIRIGEPAPDFNSSTPDGKTISLSDYRGSIVALNFWATWCAPCRVEMPVLQEAAENFGDGQLVILAVNAGESPDVIQEYMIELDLTFPAVLDEQLDIVDLYGVRVFPTTIWIDAEGIVRAEHFGPLSRNQIEEYIEQLSGQQEN